MVFPCSRCSTQSSVVASAHLFDGTRVVLQHIQFQHRHKFLWRIRLWSRRYVTQQGGPQKRRRWYDGGGTGSCCCHCRTCRRYCCSTNNYSHSVSSCRKGTCRSPRERGREHLSLLIVRLVVAAKEAIGRVSTTLYNTENDFLNVCCWCAISFRSSCFGEAGQKADRR